MTLKLTYAFVTGQLQEALQSINEPIARAATAAMSDVADSAKARGRASIAGAGFSTRWQNTLRSAVYPKGKVSMSPAAAIWHKIPYAGVFEEGAVISGKPLLWLPIEANLPLQARGKRWTVKDAAAILGPLRLVKRPGKPPLLVATVKVGKSGGVLALPSSSKTKRGDRARARFAQSKTKSLPVFVGVPQVTIGKKFDIAGAAQQAADRIGEFYNSHIETN